MNIETGKFYKTRDGRKATIYVIYEEPDVFKNIHGATFRGDQWWVCSWHKNGKFLTNEEWGLDIISEWTEPHPAESWEVDKKILVSVDEERWHKAYFSHFKNGLFYTFAYGKTSWTQQGVIGYKYAKPAEEE